MNKLPKKPRNENMYKAILSLNSVEECMRFFDDLCTVSELMAMEQRYHSGRDRRVQRDDKPREPLAPVRQRRLCHRV